MRKANPTMIVPSFRQSFRRSMTRVALGVALVLSASTAACSENVMPYLGPDLSPSAGSHGYGVMFTSYVAADGSTRLRMRLLSGGLASPIGGYRLSFTLPAGVDTVQGGAEQSAAEGSAQRLMSVNGRTVHVAGIAPTGLTIGDLFVVGLKGSDAKHIHQSLTVHELVDITGVDQLGRLVPNELVRAK